MKKKLALFLIPLAVGMVALSGCGAQQTASEAESSVAEVSSAVVSEAPKPQGNLNILTGQYNISKEAEGKRPIAVMINNIVDALPQYGISDADVMFETLVEGGITRMMAVYGDYTKVPEVCSVRSCRYYYPVLAEGMDAIYFHSGADQTIAVQTLRDLGIEHYDTDGRVFSRDQSRLNAGYAIEHTMTLHGSGIPEMLQADGIRTDLRSELQSGILKFRQDDKITAAGKGETVCNQVTYAYSPSYWSDFTYDSKDKVYRKQHNGQAHMDQTTGEQLAYTNLFVLETPISVRDAKGHMDVGLTGGNGYYISGGGCQQIQWQKSDAEDRIHILDSNGKEITVNAGKSYFGILQPNCTTIS